MQRLLTRTVTAVHREMVWPPLLRDRFARDVGYCEHLLSGTHPIVLVQFELFFLYLETRQQIGSSWASSARPSTIPHSTSWAPARKSGLRHQTPEPPHVNGAGHGTGESCGGLSTVTAPGAQAEEAGGHKTGKDVVGKNTPGQAGMRALARAGC